MTSGVTPRRCSAPDAGGGASHAWTTVETVWAGLARLSSVRDTLGGRGVKRRRIAATIRWRNDVAPGGRVRESGVDYEIVSIESDDGRERRMTLVCEEVAS